MTNSIYGIAVMLVMGVLNWIMEEIGFPIALAIPGLILGEFGPEFQTSTSNQTGRSLPSFERPIPGVLGVTTLLLWTTMLCRGIKPAVPAWRYLPLHRQRFLRNDAFSTRTCNPYSALPPPHTTLASRRLARPYLGRTSTDWTAPACGWRTYSITSSASAGS